MEHREAKHSDQQVMLVKVVEEVVVVLLTIFLLKSLMMTQCIQLMSSRT